MLRSTPDPLDKNSKSSPPSRLSQGDGGHRSLKKHASCNACHHGTSRTRSASALLVSPRHFAAPAKDASHTVAKPHVTKGWSFLIVAACMRIMPRLMKEGLESPRPAECRVSMLGFPGQSKLGHFARLCRDSSHGTRLAACLVACSPWAVAGARATKKVGRVVSEPEACSDMLHRPTHLLQSPPLCPVCDQDAMHSAAIGPPPAGSRGRAWPEDGLDIGVLLAET